MGTQHGKVLGGGSAVGYMVYVRGHREDFDSWQDLGCAGWGWASVEKYFKRLENYFIDEGEFSRPCFTHFTRIHQSELHLVCSTYKNRYNFCCALIARPLSKQKM